MRWAASTLLAALALWLAPVNSAGAAVIYTYQAKPPVAAHGAHRAASAHPASSAHPTSPAPSTARAPSGPPLTAGVAEGAGETIAGVPSAQGDQLVENGLSSPLCEGSTSGELSSAAQSNCQTSGFVGAPAPTDDYELDVNINTGALGVNIVSVIQDVFVAPLWNAVVWVVHALVVMLEWCYTLELLSGSTLSGVAASLREAQASFTEPWLVLVLAVASVLALYNGLVRRRVSETLGQALVTVAMMVAGLWMIADPVGTVGALGRWADQASLGTLGAVAQGTPADAPRTLGDSLRAVFADAIDMPWCYLEFGDVRWCGDPALLDPSLRKAAAAIVAAEAARLKCGSGCATLGSVSALTIERSEKLVRAADTNGELFLAFAANSPERNSVKAEGSLLHVLCQTENDAKCSGSTAAQAEFRSGSGTFPRMIGVVLIAAGALGMVLLLGFIAVRLLAAAVASLFLLLLAPFAVLAPALGDGGRALFAGWATRLLGAVTSKLIFSFLLGVLLTMQRTLVSLESLGWWTRWLLVAAFWWSVFFKRHQALVFVRDRGGAAAAVAARRPQSIARRIGTALETPRAMLGAARWAKGKLLPPAPGPEQLRKRAHATQQAVRERAGEQATRTLAHDHAEARARVEASPRVQASLSAKRAQLERVRRARAAALAGGDWRRAARLTVRGQRIEAELARDQESLNAARRTVADGESARRRTGSMHTREQLERRAGFLDEQAALPSGSRRREGARRRDYPALAGLAGYGPEEYRRLDPRAARQARLRIDRELAMRSQLGFAARDVTRASAPALGRRERRKVDGELDRALERRTRESGSSPPGPPPRRPPADPRDRDWTRGGGPAAAGGRGGPAAAGGGGGPAAAGGGGGSVAASGVRTGARAPRSSVMDDARAVAERRKRQLGHGPDS